MHRRSTAWRSVVSCLLLLAQVNACTHWKVQRVAPEVLLSRERPSSVRIDRKGVLEPHSAARGAEHWHPARTVIHEPRLVGDSIVGVRVKGGEMSALPGQPSTPIDTVYLAVALTDIDAIAVRRTDPVKTVALVVLTLAAGYGALACMMACGSP